MEASLLLEEERAVGAQLGPWLVTEESTALNGSSLALSFHPGEDEMKELKKSLGCIDLVQVVGLCLG